MQEKNVIYYIPQDIIVNNARASKKAGNKPRQIHFI